MAAGEEIGVVAGADVDENVQSNAQAETYTVEVLQMIKEAQQMHGLRHGDYQRYRQYCARRIRRIRKSLNFLQGTKHRVIPKKITEDNLVKDVKFLYLPLMDAERNWAYAMQLKSEANTEPRKRFHMANKLKKATQHADLLSTLCESHKCDARTKLEAKAYSSWMRATMLFERENWAQAMELFNSAKTIYQKLSSAFVDDVKEIYLARVDEISPSLRYCAYNMGDSGALDDLRGMRVKKGGEDALTSMLDELIEKTREKQAATLSEVTWRGRTVPVKNETVRLFLLSIQESERQLQEADTPDAKVSVYESLLKELIDAQQSLRDECKDDQNFKAILRGQKQDGRVPHTVYLYTYLMYLKQTKTIERNLVMIETLKGNLGKSEAEQGKKTKPQDLARLYDIVLQNLSEIPNLPGLEDDSNLSQEISIQILGYKAFRCFYIAETYAALKKFREAIALYEQVLTYGRDALQGFKNKKGEVNSNMKLLVSSLEELLKKVDGLKYSVHASSILDSEDLPNQMTTLSLKNKQPLSDRLDQYVEDPSLTGKKPALTHFPPDFEPVPCKPLFFDLALSHVEFPNLDDRLEQKKQGGGLTGFVKGLFWGGKK